MLVTPSRAGPLARLHRGGPSHEGYKIGTTTNLPQRLDSLRAQPGDLLATEPGGFDVERRRHQEFAEERFGRREDFAASDRLLAHIARLRGDTRG